MGVRMPVSTTRILAYLRRVVDKPVRDKCGAVIEASSIADWCGSLDKRVKIA